MSNDAFKLLNLKTDSRLGSKQAACAGADASSLCDGQKAAQQITVELRGEAIA
jgi:hypothetical protein